MSLIFSPKKSKVIGFTLIELMIVVAIVGIIAAIAYPSFGDSMKKARRSDAKAGMLELALAQSTIGSSNDCANKTVKGSSTSEKGYYTFAISGATGNAYTITATAQGAQTSDTGCTSLKIEVSGSNPKGAKTPTGCW